MTKITSKYLDDLRVASTHIPSGDELHTDAPKDNNGKGRCFSPTDLLATAYINCMVTIIGIYCQKNQITFHGCDGQIEKEMGNAPRKIKQLKVQLDLSQNSWSSDEKQRIERAARNCPVALSIAPSIDVKIFFNYD